MDEKMLLQAIQEIVKAEIEPLNERMGGMEQRMDGMEQRMGGMEQRMDGMEQRMGGMEQRMGGVEQRMGGVEQRMGGMEQRMDGMEQRMDRFEILLEHDIPKQLQLLAEGHQGIVKRLPEEHELDGIRSRVSTLERVVADHSEELRILKQAN